MKIMLLGVMGVLVALSGTVPTAQQAGAPGEIPIGLSWRNVGPGGTGTRIVDFAVVERTPRIVYAATASSGVWKTINAGTTWEPLFQHEQTIALGGIAVSQSNPDVVWVATGEPNMRNLRSSSWGSGIYKSTDAGRTWRQMGLADAQHMGRVVIHPTNPDVVFATVLGSMWQNNPQKNAGRGLYKTTDGGVTWRKTLSAGDNAGVVDLVMDPTQPNTLYAAAWHRQRRDWRRAERPLQVHRWRGDMEQADGRASGDTHWTTRRRCLPVETVNPLCGGRGRGWRRLPLH